MHNNEEQKTADKSDIDVPGLLAILFAQAQAHMEIHKRTLLSISALLQMSIAQRSKDDKRYNQLLQAALSLRKESDQLIENFPGFKVPEPKSNG